jgi:hypothetical protein
VSGAYLQIVDSLHAHHANRERSDWPSISESFRGNVSESPKPEMDPRIREDDEILYLPKSDSVTQCAL